MTDADTRRVMNGLECVRGYLEGVGDSALPLNLVKGAIEICECALARPDFRDDRPDDKAEAGSWSNWRNDQQPEHTPGCGRRGAF